MNLRGSKFGTLNGKNWNKIREFKKVINFLRGSWNFNPKDQLGITKENKCWIRILKEGVKLSKKPVFLV